MQWLIQHTGLPDTQTTKLLEAVQDRKLPFVPVGHIPFSHEITGLESMDLTLPSMFYGSVQLTRQLAATPSIPKCTLFEEDWFDPREWRGKRTDLLNEIQSVVPVSYIREWWCKQPVFIKPEDPIKFKGQVLEPEKEDWDNWLIEHSHLDGEDLIVISPVQKIDKEWRFFVLDGQIITGSLYKRDGYLCVREPITEEVWQVARNATKQWLPSPNIVMDIALLRSGQYKVIEFNCFNSSGFYNCDVGKIVDYMEAK